MHLAPHLFTFFTLLLSAYLCVSAFRRIHSCMDVYSCTRTRKCTESNAPGCEVRKKQESGSEQTQRQKKSYLGCYSSRETRIIRCCEEEGVRFLIRMLYMFVHFPPFYVVVVFFFSVDFFSVYFSLRLFDCLFALLFSLSRSL